MATSSHDCGDFTLCPVCLERFDTPRYLPCTHTFCHRCLSAHIVSSCKDCDPAFGFPCPLCRKFVPAPGVLHQYPPEDWASRFSENCFLKSCIQKQASLSSILCGPCGIDGEVEVKANSWCEECEDTLCENCSQNHKKYKALKSHRIYPITEYGLDITKDLKKIKAEFLDGCETHKEKQIEFMCDVHHSGCCSICVVSKHKHCEKILTLSAAADKFSDDNKTKLVEEINELILKIATIIQNEEENISDVDEKTDSYAEQIKKMIEEMVNRLRCLETTYLDQLAKISKDVRKKLEKSITLFQHRKMYLEHWLEEVLIDSQNKKQHVLTCLKTHEVLNAVKDLPIHQMNFAINAQVTGGVERIDSLGTLFCVKAIEKSQQKGYSASDTHKSSRSSTDAHLRAHEKLCYSDKKSNPRIEKTDLQADIAYSEEDKIYPDAECISSPAGMPYSVAEKEYQVAVKAHLAAEKNNHVAEKAFPEAVAEKAYPEARKANSLADNVYFVEKKTYGKEKTHPLTEDVYPVEGAERTLSKEEYKRLKQKRLREWFSHKKK